MKRFILILLLAVAGWFVAFPCSGQLLEPEPLTYSKLYQLPGTDVRTIERMFIHWDAKDCGLTYKGSYPVWEKLESGATYVDRPTFSGEYAGLDFGRTKGELDVTVDMKVIDGAFWLVMKEVRATWGRHFRELVSDRDDKFNRTWLWRVLRSRRTLEQIRLRAAEIFEQITASMDRFLAEGPPMEMREIG